MSKIYGDWRDQRAAMEAAYKEIGEEVGGNLPPRDWKFVDSVIKHYVPLQPECATCNTTLNWSTAIRCLDCKMVLCEHCAPKHFGR